MPAMLLDAAVVLVAVLAVTLHRLGRPTPCRIRFDAPVIDERTDRDLRSRYLHGQIAIDDYLDRRFGTTFATSAKSTGDGPGAG